MKNSFHHIHVYCDFQEYLVGFTWQNKQFVWCVLPFVCNISPFFFKCLKAVVHYLRELGVRIVLYVDDAMLCCTAAEYADHIDLVCNNLKI